MTEEQSETIAEEARGTSGRTGQSLGELTEQRGDPSGKRLDLDEPTTAPLQSESAEDAGSEPARGIATTPGAADKIADAASASDQS